MPNCCIPTILFCMCDWDAFVAIFFVYLCSFAVCCMTLTIDREIADNIDKRCTIYVFTTLPPKSNIVLFSPIFLLHLCGGEWGREREREKDVSVWACQFQLFPLWSRGKSERDRKLVLIKSQLIVCFYIIGICYCCCCYLFFCITWCPVELVSYCPEHTIIIFEWQIHERQGFVLNYYNVYSAYECMYVCVAFNKLQLAYDICMYRQFNHIVASCERTESKAYRSQPYTHQKWKPSNAGSRIFSGQWLHSNKIKYHDK